MPSSGFGLGGLNITQWLHVVHTNVYAYTTLITDKSSMEKFDRQSIWFTGYYFVVWLLLGDFTFSTTYLDKQEVEYQATSDGVVDEV